jgi:hypothetical protein
MLIFDMVRAQNFFQYRIHSVTTESPLPTRADYTRDRDRGQPERVTRCGILLHRAPSRAKQRARNNLKGITAEIPLGTLGDFAS